MKLISLGTQKFRVLISKYFDSTWFLLHDWRSVDDVTDVGNCPKTLILVQKHLGLQVCRRLLSSKVCIVPLGRLRTVSQPSWLLKDEASINVVCPAVESPHMVI